MAHLSSKDTTPILLDLRRRWRKNNLDSFPIQLSAEQSNITLEQTVLAKCPTILLQSPFSSLWLQLYFQAPNGEYSNSAEARRTHLI
jgi:ABC-type uncharacterized transport system YnjBCD ATPase subunit